MLCCEQDKYTYTPDGTQLHISNDYSIYNGWTWTITSKKENDYDSYGKIIRQKVFRDNPSHNELVCTKEKTFVRNPDQTYDPDTTIYRDLQNNIVEKKLYWRQKTDLSDKPLLFVETTHFSSKGRQTHSSYFFHLHHWLPAEHLTAPTTKKQKLGQTLRKASSPHSLNTRKPSGNQIV